MKKTHTTMKRPESISKNFARNVTVLMKLK